MTEMDLQLEGLTAEEALAKSQHYLRLSETLRKNKLAGVIASIKDLVEQHDLKPADIFLGINEFHGTPKVESIVSRCTVVPRPSHGAAGLGVSRTGCAKSRRPVRASTST